MTAPLPIYPFEADREIGTATEVGPTFAKANLPAAAECGPKLVHGHSVGGGVVGEFVVVECGDAALFGRVTHVRLPERDRLSVEPRMGENPEVHPVGTIQLLTTIELSSGVVSGGVSRYPRVGARVFGAHPALTKWLAETEQSGRSGGSAVTLELAALASDLGVTVALTPERLFGRHCAVLGSTGGGKSWTLGRMIEAACCHNGKVILLDATGEFHTLGAGVRHVHLGSATDDNAGSTEVVFPYTNLTETDLLSLFRPAGQTQGPKLRAAMKSLKLARLEPKLTPNGRIVKANRAKRAFDDAYKAHAVDLESAGAEFDIELLTSQLDEECVWATGRAQGRQDPSSWGGYNENERSYCVTLVTRIEDMIHAPELACVFNPGDRPDLQEEIESFLDDDGVQVLRVSMKHLPFSHNTREIVANAIGRHLLGRARDGRFQQRPLLVLLDEAHQFLNKSLGDENSRHALDAFELVAKEGRKFSLNICLSTQRPRDIPEGVLSQMGTLVVHRLTNDRDREIVERASGDIDRSAAAFLPTLAPGEAIVIGVDFPIPLSLQISAPTARPDSTGPDYQQHWART